MAFSDKQVFGCVGFVILYVIWVVIISECDRKYLRNVRDKMFVQYSLLDGKEVQENIEKKRTSFIGFFVTDEEKKKVIKMAEDSNANISDLCRHVLYLDPVKDDLNK